MYPEASAGPRSNPGPHFLAETVPLFFVLKFQGACFVGSRVMRRSFIPSIVPNGQPWTDEEVHRLRGLAKKKISADEIAKSLGRHVGSVKKKARELNLIPLKKTVKAK
jgi:hypothetical protein